MSRLFITERELEFIHDIADEVLQKIVGQEVNYHAISLEHTRTNDIYGEAVQKTWLAPVKVNALVYYENPTVKSTGMGLDADYRVEVYFHDRELIDRNVQAREGDFIEFGAQYYEIASVTRPQIVFGQIQQKIMVKCVCVPARQGQFQAGSDSSRGIVNAHPVSDPDCRDE